ncbi:MAG: hypothetical protein B7Y08_18965 [Rhodospirillales bacterium 24-66-33]|jgi:hypothetical protein|nr:hypothetical protein [Reyranella sp.]OYY39536.1 MAG: hypothetical protein B7Y57_20015 [Rhodospirillales bacterium 35-66-84]OYZ92897.1 MAG: hypothetical protein B7Y08_18965 [Rhodospirillales bacterium 24-66-33]OZB24336.1 MAG: hypothetical protein B7X63_15635 [Rhodospirillales bacterium 39-66-50]HQS14605.1 hypothetical protein [Reyranella sp.]HQT12481.1 hypothetical protein [Reyranella sp.]
MESVKLIDVSDGAASGHVRQREAEALAVRDACLGWLPLGGLLARLADPIVRGWMKRSGTAYTAEIDSVARTLKKPGIWLLHGAYLFGCTALADDTAQGPRLRRTLDWPFPGLGRLVEVRRHRGAAGEFLNVTWPGFVGVLTAVAPGRFAASINQAPMRRRWRTPVLLWLDYVLNALAGLRSSGRLPPEHLLRHVFETCASFDEAQHLLETAPVARPVLFLLVGTKPGERIVIEREETSARTYRDDTVFANDWRERHPTWRPRACGSGEPVENNIRRRTALAAWSGRDADDFDWVTAPVLNACTRLSVEMCPATGQLTVAGWEADSGSATRVTAISTFQQAVQKTRSSGQ